MPVLSEQVASLDELVTKVLAVCRDLPEGRAIWYRGHARSSYELLPSILRDGKAVPEVFEREERLITRFRQRSLPYWPAGYPQNDWEQLFAMQHHGIPTRLLDWSENLFVAVHFALEGASDAEDPPVVWCVDPIEWNRAAPVLSEYGDGIHVLTTAQDEAEPYRPNTSRRRSRSPVAIYGTHNSNRIVAQRGTFMIWGEGLNKLEDHVSEKSRLWRFELQADADAMRRDLNSLGFVESMIYPELSALSKELARIEGWR